MNEMLKLICAGAGGGVLGTIFFGGLWWTINQGVASSVPALWFLGSLVLRTSLVLAGFYWLGNGDWKRLVACLLGFVAARLTVTYLTRPTAGKRLPDIREGSHAP